MESQFGNDIYTVTDENGQEIALEHLTTLEVENEYYMAFVPADMDEDDPDYGIVMLKVVEENGEEFFETIDEDDEREAIYEMFMEELFGDDEDDILDE